MPVARPGDGAKHGTHHGTPKSTRGTYVTRRRGLSVSAVANVEKKMPRDFITADGFHITTKCRNYLAPLVSGEAYPPYEGGLPRYVRLKNAPVKKKTRSEFKL